LRRSAAIGILGRDWHAARRFDTHLKTVSLRRLFRSPSFWPLQIAGWSAYLVMVVATFLPVLGPDRGTWPLIEVKTVRTLSGFLLTCGLRLVLRRFASRGSFVQTALVVVTGAVVGGMLWLTIMSVAFQPAARASMPMVERMVPAPREWLDYALTLLAWSALYLGLRWWQELQDERARALEATALAQQAQLDALRYQLNPHFLFNGLNSIRALIDEDAGRARRMITALSEFLRYPLTSAAGHDVPLATEIAALRNYLALEQIRFEDRLQVTIDISEDADSAAVPSFLLHPLVENAITHGFSSSPTPLTLRVAARVRDEMLCVEVINSGRWRPTHASADRRGTGTGLRNVQSRLEVVAPRAHQFSIDDQGGCVAVRMSLPYRPLALDEDVPIFAAELR
jgi:two-component system, LytTR family, sensor kinase